MLCQKWLHLGLALALVFLVASPALATVKVKSVAPDQKQITVTDKDGKDWTYTLTDDAKIFLPDNTDGKLNDLKTGDEVGVLWEKRGDKLFSNAILKQEGDLKAAMLTLGVVKRVNADQKQIVITDANNKEFTYQFADNGRVSVGTNKSKLTDLRDGDKVLLVYEKKGDHFIVRDICADRR
jgi:Cu/Ag efflux protein CusF